MTSYDRERMAFASGLVGGRGAGRLHHQEARPRQRQGQQREGRPPALAKDTAQPQPDRLRDPGQTLSSRAVDAVAAAGADTIGGKGLAHADARAVPQRQQRRKAAARRSRQPGQG